MYNINLWLDGSHLELISVKILPNIGVSLNFTQIMIRVSIQQSLLKYFLSTQSMK